MEMESTVTCCGSVKALLTGGGVGFCSFCASRAGNSFDYDPNPNSFDDSQNLSDYPPQPQYQTYSCELCENNAHYGYDCETPEGFVMQARRRKLCVLKLKHGQSRGVMARVSKSYEEFNPIHNEDLDSTPKNDRFDTESYLLESLLNRDTLMASSPMIDSLLDEFAGELITIPPRIVNRDTRNLLRSLWIEDSGSLREEIDIFPGPDDSIPPGIESDDYDSESDDDSTSFPEFESFHVDYPYSRDSTIDMVEDIPVYVPNILPTHPTLHMDFDFIPSHNDPASDLDVSSPSEDRNKIYDPGICIEVESTRFLATHSPVIDTLLPFSSKNEDKAFNHGVLASKEKSLPSSSHRGFKASKLFHHKSLMWIYGEYIPILDVPFLHFYPP
ncbi:hypothetical protein Tco_0583559 [Tanacetum coccineum]